MAEASSLSSATTGSGVSAAAQRFSQQDTPLPVVRVFSVRGIEYLLMTIALWLGAAGLVSLVVSLIQGDTGFGALSFPISLLVTALPVFAFLFLRLRSAELKTPALRYEPSKRRCSQFSQILSFLISFFAVVGIIYTLLQAVAGHSDDIWKVLGSLVVLLIVAGGILWYYWCDEHKFVK